MKIKIEDIRINDGRRKIDEKTVNELMGSIECYGLINPVTVDKNMVLIAGNHRLQACKRLGWEEIECTVMDLDKMKAELAEIDENLIRKELDFIEQGEQLARRKEIYEALHPETKNGGGRKSEIRWPRRPSDSQKSFSEDTASKTGISDRSIRKKIQIARDLQPEVKEIVRESGIGSELAVKLARIKDPEEQKDTAQKLAAGEIKASEITAKPVKPKTTRDIVAEIKDTEKDFTCTPDMLIAEYGASAASFAKSLDMYQDPYYSHAFSSMTDAQFEKMQSISAAISTAMQRLESLRERN